MNTSLSLSGTGTAASAFSSSCCCSSSDEQIKRDIPAACDSEMRRYLPEDFHNPRKRQQQSQKGIKKRKVAMSSQKKARFSMDDAFLLFRDNYRPLFKDNGYTQDDIDQAITEEWQESDSEVRSKYIRMAWSKYEQQLSLKNMLCPQHGESSGASLPIATEVVTPSPAESKAGSIKELHRDKDIVVIEKPSGLASHSSRNNNNKDNVLDRLKEINPDIRLVHRLDKGTSGLMVLALNDQSAKHLGLQFRNRQIHKKYTANIWRKPPQKEGYVDLSLGYDDKRRRQTIDRKNGKPSLTLYQAIESSHEHYGRVTLEPVTGRTHQLRAHMGAAGFPILGCNLYGHQKSFDASDRLQLHASELELAHPSGDTMKFESEPPF